MTHLSWTLDTIGPLARDPGTLGAILSVIEGPDAADLLNTPLNADQPQPTTLVGLRLGVPDAANLAVCEDIVLDAFERFKLALTDAGVILTPINVKGWSPGAVRRAGLLISEVEGAEVLGNTLEGPGLSDEFRAMLIYGRRAAAGQLALAYHKMQALAVSFDHAVVGLDGLLLPTAPQRAFAHDGAVPVNQADFTALANMVGAPAMTIPLSSPDGELPCAAQIVGQRGSDHSLIAMGEFLKDLSPVLRIV
jgi:aspartyl-tRNA(Asn)/glutamyl-tRNA(Gln) amidotransferase subunit A